jgi:hypothetical protein
VWHTPCFVLFCFVMLKSHKPWCFMLCSWYRELYEDTFRFNRVYFTHKECVHNTLGQWHRVTLANVERKWVYLPQKGTLIEAFIN